MHVNKPEMAKDWEKKLAYSDKKEKKMKREQRVRELIKKMVREELAGLDEAAKRDYKAEYKKFQSSDKSKKYRAELNKYNRQKGTYGNGDGKDASHKGGKIVGFEKESVNRGRAEKSRLKKEDKDGFANYDDKGKDTSVKFTKNKKTGAKKVKKEGKLNERLRVVDERYVGKFIIWVLQDGNKIRTAVLGKKGFDNFSSNDPDDLNKLWNLAKKFKGKPIPDIATEGKLTERNEEHFKKSVEMMYKDIDRLIKTFNTTDYKKNKKAKKFIYTAQQLKLKLHMALSGITHNVKEGKLTETLNKLTEKLSKSEIKKMKDKFDKTGKLPPHLVKLSKLIDKHTEIKNVIVPGLEWMADIDEGKITEAKETIFDVAAKVMKDSQNYNYKSKKGMVKVDMQTANLLTKVFKKVSPKMKKHLAGMGESNPAGLVQTLWAAVK